VSLAGLILAAGASRRMGSPKALLQLRGETFLDRLIDGLAAVCSPVIVVLGYDAEAIRGGIRRGDEVVFTVNPDPSRGQLSSLKCGLAPVPAEAEGVIFTPVDYAGVRRSTIVAIGESFRHRSPGTLLVIPRCEGRRGHPVCAARDLFAELLVLPEEAQARDVIHQHRDRTAYVDVDDPGILLDADDPAAYRALSEAADSRP